MCIICQVNHILHTVIYIFLSFKSCFIPVFDVNDESMMVGTMNVTVECVAALRAVEQELDEYDQE